MPRRICGSLQQTPRRSRVRTDGLIRWPRSQAHGLERIHSRDTSINLRLTSFDTSRDLRFNASTMGF